jgi:hypothetical protein
MPCPIMSGVTWDATTAVAGAVAAAKGTAMPVAMDPAAAAAIIARVMIRLVRIESSMAKAEVRSLRPGTRRPTRLHCHVEL